MVAVMSARVFLSTFYCWGLFSLFVWIFTRTEFVCLGNLSTIFLRFIAFPFPELMSSILEQAIASSGSNFPFVTAGRFHSLFFLGCFSFTFVPTLRVRSYSCRFTVQLFCGVFDVTNMGYIFLLSRSGGVG